MEETPDAASWEASRRLLRRVRDLMAAAGSTEERLNRVVRIVATEMVAEVCSIYLVRDGHMLELFATEGLNKAAVHVTRLQLGEGLVGDIALHGRPLALADAQSHPNFAYRPETGEDIYNSLMGVPILRAGRALGVVAVQNRTKRAYTDDEIETLQTVAMVLAEVAAGATQTPQDALSPVDRFVRPLRMTGSALSPGLAIGVAVLHEPQIPIRRMVAEDPRAEQERLSAALKTLHASVDDLLAAADLAEGGEHRQVLETYRMFARDRGWLTRIREAVRGGLSAEAAVRKVQDDTRARMRQVRDAYIRERLSDLDDLSNRLLQHLVGPGEGEAAGPALPEDAVLVARSIGPAELLDYDRTRLRGIVLEEGSPTAHATIVARALDLPVLGRVDEARDRMRPGDSVILDADHGQLFIRPSDDLRQTYVEGLALRRERQAHYAAMRDLPAETRDGIGIELNINAGLIIDVEHLATTGAAGVGLYRTEIAFMVRDRFPDVDTQTALYRQIMDVAAGRPVAFRTLDVGGDKLLPYLRGERDENPALGWRALRVSLDRPFMLRRQLRALIRAARGQRLDVMFPMVSEVAELDQALNILEIELESEEARGNPRPEILRVGAMLEVPALAWQLPALLPRVDFISVGSNDLLQFLFASDRGNPRVASRYDTLAPAVLAFFSDLLKQCEAARVPLSVCGEMAGRPLEAMALIGLGFRSLSASPPAIGPIKAMARSLEAAPLARYLQSLVSLPDHSLRSQLRAYAADHSVLV